MPLKVTLDFPEGGVITPCGSVYGFCLKVLKLQGSVTCEPVVHVATAAASVIGEFCLEVILS